MTSNNNSFDNSGALMVLLSACLSSCVSFGATFYANYYINIDIALTLSLSRYMLNFLFLVSNLALIELVSTKIIGLNII